MFHVSPSPVNIEIIRRRALFNRTVVFYIHTQSHLLKDTLAFASNAAQKHVGDFNARVPGTDLFATVMK